MGAFIIAGQVYVHVDFRYGLLFSHVFIQNRNGVPNALDAHLVDINIPVVSVILNVFHKLPFSNIFLMTQYMNLMRKVNREPFAVYSYRFGVAGFSAETGSLSFKPFWGIDRIHAFCK